jgi:putative ABC transport system permease protein
MWRWAYRSFLEERASLAASAAGVAVVFLLVMILEGAFQGEADQVVAFVERTDAPVWVMQKGVANMHMASSALGADVAAQLEHVPGVARVEGILYSGGLAQIGREERAIYLVGIRPGQRVGPWDVVAGTARPRAGEIVVPTVLAQKGGVGLGATVTVARRPFKVVGLSRGTYSMANSLAFIHASDLASLFDVVADANYYLVWPEPGVGTAQLMARLGRAAPEVALLEREALVYNDRDLALKMGGELIRIMTVVAGLVAALIVGFTVFTFTARRARELAVAKAVGAGAGQLLAAAMGQAGALALAGFALAASLAALLQPVFARYAPGVIIHFSLASMARIGVAAVIVSMVAGMLPAWRVLRVDPTLVFSS